MKKKLLMGVCSLAFVVLSNDSSATLINHESYEAMFQEPVTTSANGSPQRLSDVPLNMEIITANEIDKMGARSIPEILRFIPGVNVRQFTIGQYEVGIRGYNQANSERILVLLDGRQVYQDSFGQVVWESIPVNIGDIQQIEVIKGPNTALFGFNAVSGVINIVTKNQLNVEMAQLKTNVSIGAESLIEGSASYMMHTEDKKYGLRFSARAHEADDEFKSYGLTGTDQPSADTLLQSFLLGVEAHPTEKTSINIEVSKNDVERNEYLVVGYKGTNYYSTDSIKLSYEANTDLGMINFDSYFNQSQQDYFRGALFDVDNRIFVTKLSDTFEYNKDHIFRLGVEYRDASNIYEPYDGDDLTYKIYSTNGLWSWQVSDDLKSSFAVRYDYFELEPDGNNVSPAFLGLAIAELGFTQDDFNQTREEVSVNLGFAYKLSDKETLRASYARGIDLPSFTEFGIQMPTLGDEVRYVGNPYIDTSIVSNYELGYEKYINRIKGSFKGAIFYQESEDMQGFSATSVNDVTRIDITGNIGDSSALGFELSLDGKYKENWNWNLNYSFVNVDDNFNYKAGNVYKSAHEYDNSNVDHTANVTVGYTQPKWHGNISLQYLSPHTDLRAIEDADGDLEAVSTGSEFVLNAHYQYNINDHISWSVNGQNMLGDTQQYAASNAEPFYWTSLEINF